jgi:hypothetical protein
MSHHSNRRVGRFFILTLSAMWAAMGTVAAAPTAVLQRGYTTGVINANGTETILTTANVTPTTFGRIFSLPVDGRIYAQPLYVPAVTIPGHGVHNVLYVATMADSVFAFDADVPQAPLWSATYVPSGASPEPIVDLVGTDSLNIAGPVGIESTPVIDATTNTMYFVTNTLESGAPVYRLHGIDITTGAEKNGGPVVIDGSVTVGGTTVTFTPSLENQRTSLTIAQNQVIVGFGSHEDFYQYYGWLMSYDKTSLAQTGILNTQPTTGHGSAIWQTGRPPVVDSSGYVYVFTGNGFLGSGSSTTWDGVNNFPESVLKLDPGHGLKVLDYFTPNDYQALDSADADLASSGPTLIPGTNLLVGGGKSGTIYLLNSQNLGHLQANDAGAVQSFAGASGEIRGGPAYWARSTAAGGPVVFNWAANDSLKSFAFNGSTLNTTPTSQYTPAINLYPGGELTLSSNGDSQGIVWALLNGQGDADHRVPPGTLVAVSAANVSQALWLSTTNAPRDAFGLYAKWVPPLVSNGKVYVATSSNQVVVYGLLPSSGTVTVWPAAEATFAGTASFVVNALSTSGTDVAATWSVAGLPTGAAGNFTTNSQGQTILQITVAPNTSPANYPITVTATVNGSLEAQTALLRVVTANPTTAASAVADSSQSGNPPSNAIDNNTSTFWHTEYTPSLAAYPHSITVDLGSVQPVTGLSYLARQDGCINGTELQYEVHLSTDGVNFQEVTGGSFDYGPDWYAYNCAGEAFFLPKQQNVAFAPTNARYVELVGLGSVIDGNPWASAAEVHVYTAVAAAPTPQTITFPAVAAQHVGTALTLGATASSGLTVSYASSTTGVCTVAGATATMLTAGTCTITASQSGGSGYAAATPVSQSFAVTGNPGITLTPASSTIAVTAPNCSGRNCRGGKSGTDVITQTAVNGFAGKATYTVAGVPSWISPSFNPTSVTGGGSTTLTLTPTKSSGGTHSRGTALTVTATSGSVSATTTITLTY